MSTIVSVDSTQFQNATNDIIDNNANKQQSSKFKSKTTIVSVDSTQLQNATNDIIDDDANNQQSSQLQRKIHTRIMPSHHSAAATHRRAEYKCVRSIFDLWDVFSFFMVKIFPCMRPCPCYRSCRKNQHGQYPHMRSVIDRAHMNIPVTYDDILNLLNSFLLMSALFLSFVATSTTVLGKSDFLLADLTACQRGWAHVSICKELDRAGYFGSMNATWLLNATDVIGLTLRPVEDGQTNLEYSMYESINIQGQAFGTVWDSTHLISGNELPSFAIMYYSSITFGLLMMVILSGFLHMLCLTLSGAKTDESIMLTFWNGSMSLIVLDIGAILSAMFFWMQSMSRIITALWPSYNLHGLNFVWFTHSDEMVNYGVMFNAYSSEGVVAWGVILFAISILYLVVQTFDAELKYLTSERPKTIVGFVVRALAPLRDDVENEDGEDAVEERAEKKRQEMSERQKSASQKTTQSVTQRGTQNETQSVTQSVTQRETASKYVVAAKIEQDISSKRSKAVWDATVCRVVGIFQAQGYRTGGEVDATEREKELANQDMKHFIKEFEHLDWKEMGSVVNEKGGGNSFLSVREKACLIRLHTNLFGATCS